MKKLRKALIVSVMFMTVISMSVIAAPNVNAAASAGDLIKMDGLSSVYYLAADGKRYVFPNETTYLSWYPDFSSVVTIPQSELEGYPLGANVTVRPGTKLVKITTDPKVYAVEPGGSLVHVASEAAATTLYGSNWASRVVDVPDAFFTNYTVSSSELDGTAYPTGSLIKTASSPDVYYIDANGNARKIVDDAAFSANRFQAANIIITTLAIPALGADIIGAESALIDTSSGAGGTAGAGTGLTISLASNTPASATVITNTLSTGNGQAMVPFTTINFTAASDGDVRVDTVRVKRTGISTDSDVENLYLFDGDTRLTDASSVSSGYATFNNAVAGLFTVPAGQTKTITVKGDILYSATSGKTIGFSVESASDVVTDGASVSGTFPLSGNPMSTAIATDLGKLTFSSPNTPSAADTSVDSDTNDQELWKVTLVGSNQELAVEKLVFTAVGSIRKDDLANFKLYQGGTLLGEAASLNDNNEVVIDMSANPFIIPKGASRVISLRGDILKGSTRTVYFSFQNSADVVVKDTNYGVYVQPYTAGSWSVVLPGSSANWLISSGSLSINKSTNSPTEDVVVDGTSVVLGEWDFKASGENIKIKNLNVRATVSTYGGIDNGKVYVDGTQVGTTKDLTQGTDVNFTFGSTFVVAAGTTAKVQVIGDIKSTTSTSFSGGETVAVRISAGSGNAQRVSSLGTFNAPSSAVTANTLNITAAALTISKFSGYGDQTIVAGTNNAKVGSFVLQAGAAEGVDVGSITVTLSSNEQATVTNMVLKDHADGTTLLGAEKVNPSTSNIYSVNGLSVPASGSKVIDIYANIISGSDSGSWVANISSEGSGTVTGNAVSAAGANIQTITIGSGALYANNGSNADAAIVIAGSTGNASTQVTFSASNEGYTISQLLLKTENNFSSNTAQVTISYKDKSGNTQTASAPFIASASLPYATATFTGLTMYVPNGGDSNLNTSVDTVLLSQNGASGNNGKIYFDYTNGFKATGDSGSSKSSVGSADISGNSMYVRKSKPTFAKQSISTTPSSSSDLFKFSVVADGAGNVEIKQLSFNFSTSGVTVLGAYLYDPNTSTVITDTAINPDGSGDVKLIVGAVDNDVLTIGTTAKTYSVRGTVAGWGDTGDTMTVKFKQDTSAGSPSTASSETIRGSVNNVWSDRSAANHSTTSADWTNAYLLKNMTDAQSF